MNHQHQHQHRVRTTRETLVALSPPDGFRLGKHTDIPNSLAGKACRPPPLGTSITGLSRELSSRTRALAHSRTRAVTTWPSMHKARCISRVTRGSHLDAARDESHVSIARRVLLPLIAPRDGAEAEKRFSFGDFQRGWSTSMDIPPLEDPTRRRR